MNNVELYLKLVELEMSYLLRCVCGMSMLAQSFSHGFTDIFHIHTEPYQVAVRFQTQSENVWAYHLSYFGLGFDPMSRMPGWVPCPYMSTEAQDDSPTPLLSWCVAKHCINSSPASLFYFIVWCTYWKHQDNMF